MHAALASSHPDSSLFPTHPAITQRHAPVKSLRVVLLQQLENGQQHFDVKVAGAQACMDGM
jgi:hypothetical protein